MQDNKTNINLIKKVIDPIRNEQILEQDFTLPIGVPLNMPSNIQVEGNIDNITIRWDKAINIDEYILQRRNLSTDEITIITSNPVTDNFYIDYGEVGFPLNPETNYQYTLQSFHNNEISDNVISNQISLSTSKIIPEYIILNNSNNNGFINIDSVIDKKIVQVTNNIESNNILEFGISYQGEEWIEDITPKKGFLDPGETKSVTIKYNTEILTQFLAYLESPDLIDILRFWTQRDNIYIRTNSTEEEKIKMIGMRIDNIVFGATT